MRRLVLEDEISDLSDIENEINSDFTNSSETEMSEGSNDKVAFWKDINTKDDDYKRAIVIRKYRDEKIRKV